MRRILENLIHENPTKFASNEIEIFTQHFPLLMSFVVKMWCCFYEKLLLFFHVVTIVFREKGKLFKDLLVVLIRISHFRGMRRSHLLTYKMMIWVKVDIMRAWLSGDEKDSFCIRMWNHQKTSSEHPGRMTFWARRKLERRIKIFQLKIQQCRITCTVSENM